MRADSTKAAGGACGSGRAGRWSRRRLLPGAALARRGETNMRALGFLFLLVLVLGAVGFWRGWFTVRSASAGDRRSVEFEVDRGKIDEDARDVRDRVGTLSRRATDKVKDVARPATANEKVVEGSVAKVDATKRDLTVMSGNEEIDVPVPAGVPIRRAGHDVALAELATGSRVSLTFDVQNDTWRLQRIELLS